MLSYKPGRGASVQQLYQDFVKTMARRYVRRHIPKPQKRNPNMVGSTDATQSMKDYTTARLLGLPAGEVDKFRSEPGTETLLTGGTT